MQVFNKKRIQDENTRRDKKRVTKRSVWKHR
jgi:hypothetical protein